MDVNGFTFIMDKDLYNQAQPVRIDLSYMGFRVDSQLKFDSGGSGCSSCSTCG